MRKRLRGPRRNTRWQEGVRSSATLCRDATTQQEIRSVAQFLICGEPGGTRSDDVVWCDIDRDIMNVTVISCEQQGARGKGEGRT